LSQKKLIAQALSGSRVDVRVIAGVTQRWLHAFVEANFKESQ